MNDKLRAAAQAVADLLAEAWIAELEAASGVTEVGDGADGTVINPNVDQHDSTVVKVGQHGISTSTES